MLLGPFIFANLESIVARTRASRTDVRIVDSETNGVRVFLDQVIEALQVASADGVPDHSHISMTAGRHGRDLLAKGLTIGQVVHEYGDICQTITSLAVQQEVRILAAEFRTLNLCLDHAIAEAVTAYSRAGERALTDRNAERLGVLAHELRNLLNAAMLSFDSLRVESVGLIGRTGSLHVRSLMGLRDLITRSLAEVRLDTGIDCPEHLSVAKLIDEVEIGARMQAHARHIDFSVGPVDPALAIFGDSQVLAAALTNLLQNAFKFTPPHGHVSLTTRESRGRVLFEVEDECGGLPPGKAEDLFAPYSQRGVDRSGVGLGLSICMKAARASSGDIEVRDIPGRGCVFTLDLPRRSMSSDTQSVQNALSASDVGG